MTQIIRSKEQIEKLANAIEKEAEALPPINLFGESTEESKQESLQWAKELRTAAEIGVVTDEWSEAGYWLTNEKGTLGRDYGIE